MITRPDSGPRDDFCYSDQSPPGAPRGHARRAAGVGQSDRARARLPRAARRVGRVIDTTGFILGLYDDCSQMVEIVSQIEAGVELPGGSFPLGDGFLSEVIRTRQPRHIRHWTVEGPRVQVQYATDTPGLPESTVTVPLLVGHRAIGVLSIQSYTRWAYDEDDLLLVQ